MQTDQKTAPSGRETTSRQRLMAACAQATPGELSATLEALSPLPGHSDLRRPETGLVMLRGRTGGDGAPFNVGEATVSRASVMLASGEVGHGYLLGRDAGRARMAALVDALAQISGNAARIAALLVEPVERRIAADREAVRRQTAATRVNFFTMVRGED